MASMTEVSPRRRRASRTRRRAKTASPVADWSLGRLPCWIGVLKRIEQWTSVGLAYVLGAAARRVVGDRAPVLAAWEDLAVREDCVGIHPTTG